MKYFRIDRYEDFGEICLGTIIIKAEDLESAVKLAEKIVKEDEARDWVKCANPTYFLETREISEAEYCEYVEWEKHDQLSSTYYII